MRHKHLHSPRNAASSSTTSRLSRHTPCLLPRSLSHHRINLHRRAETTSTYASHESSCFGFLCPTLFQFLGGSIVRFLCRLRSHAPQHLAHCRSRAIALGPVQGDLFLCTSSCHFLTDRTTVSGRCRQFSSPIHGVAPAWPRRVSLRHVLILIILQLVE